MVRKERKSIVDFSNMGDTDFLNEKEQNPAEANEQSFVSDNKQNFADTNTQQDESTNEQESKLAIVQKGNNTNGQNSKNADEHDSKKEKMRRITFNIPESLYKQLKWLSVQEDKTMLDIGAAMAKEYIEKRKG